MQEEDRSSSDELRAAAVREVFEETGILLARGARDPDCDRVRRRLQAGSPFAAALDEARLEADLDELTLFARWVTPAQVRRRYDARFYLARCPEGQTVRPQEGEVTDWRWISPASALASDEITLVYATRAVLESVADSADAPSLLERARALTEVPIVEPRIIQTETGWKIVRD